MPSLLGTDVMSADVSPPTEDASSPIAAEDGLQRELAAALRGLSFGQITLIVHDGAIVQIDRLERKRLKPGLDVTGT